MTSRFSPAGHSAPFAVLTLLLSGLLLTLGACQSEGPNAGVTVGDIEGNPEQYFGQRVVVSGDVDDVYRSSFTIGGEGFGGELLIIVPSDAQVNGGRSGNQPYADDDIVQVTGTVRQYVVADLESEFGLDLGTEIEYEEQEPAIVAESISITPRTGGGSGSMRGQQQRDFSGRMRSTQGEGPAVTDAVLVVANAATYAGRTVDFDSVMVSQVVSDSTFWIRPQNDGNASGQQGDGSGELFVFLNEQRTPDTATEGRYDINQGQMISLQGSLRSLPSMDAINQRMNLDDQMQSRLQSQQYYLWAQQASILNMQGGGM